MFFFDTCNAVAATRRSKTKILPTRSPSQLQHCTYQRKTLLFGLIKVSTFLCKREILGCSSPLTATQGLRRLVSVKLRITRDVKSDIALVAIN